MSLKKKTDYIPIKCEGWNGKFAVPENIDPKAMPVAKARLYNQNITDPRNFFSFQTKPEMLPTQWDGRFNGSKQEEIVARQQVGNQNRNASSAGNIHGYTNETVILPTQWSGKFELDPNDVRILPERNSSDNRDYMDNTLLRRCD